MHSWRLTSCDGFLGSKGLGKDGSGIVEPVEAVVLPQGKTF